MKTTTRGLDEIPVDAWKRVLTFKWLKVCESAARLDALANPRFAERQTITF